jgi:hypothetical protein
LRLKLFRIIEIARIALSDKRIEEDACFSGDDIFSRLDLLHRPAGEG